MKCGVLPEHPMPEKTATRCGSSCISRSVICIALTIPKSPQPGHQSLWTCVLYVFSSSMRNRDLLDSVPYYVFDSFVYFVLRKRSSVILDNGVVSPDAGFLTDQPCHLSRVVVFDCNFSSSGSENLV